MSVFKKQFSRALRIYPSNTVNIPFPNLVAQGSPTNAGPNLLIDGNADFITQGIQVGDTVFFDLNSSYAIVVSVDNATTLTLSENIVTGLGQYSIYQGTNQGCYIYVESESPERIFAYTLNSPDSPILFDKMPPGEILPVQVLRISTLSSAVGFIALWP